MPSCPVSARRDTILATVADLVVDFVYYDRKDDDELPRGSIQEAIVGGEITETEIVEHFARHPKERLPAER